MSKTHPKYVNLVFARHKGNPKVYLFQAPLGEEILECDRLLANTSKGVKNDIIANSRNVILYHKDARIVARNFGAGWPLAMVVGHMRESVQIIKKDEAKLFPGYEKLGEVVIQYPQVPGITPTVASNLE